MAVQDCVSDHAEVPYRIVALPTDASPVLGGKNVVLVLVMVLSNGAKRKGKKKLHCWNDIMNAQTSAQKVGFACVDRRCNERQHDAKQMTRKQKQKKKPKKLNEETTKLKNHRKSDLPLISR